MRTIDAHAHKLSASFPSPGSRRQAQPRRLPFCCVRIALPAGLLLWALFIIDYRIPIATAATASLLCAGAWAWRAVRDFLDARECCAGDRDGDER